MAKASRGRVAEHKKRRVEQGLRRISVWVPEQEVGRVQAIAAALRAEVGVPLPADGEPPKVVYPDVRGSEETEFVYVELGIEEVLERTVLKANGAHWNGQRKRWVTRRDVVDQLGLSNRVTGVVEKMT